MDFSYTSYLLKARVVLPCGEAVGLVVGEAVGLGALDGINVATAVAQAMGL